VLIVFNGFRTVEGRRREIRDRERIREEIEGDVKD